MNPRHRLLTRTETGVAALLALAVVALHLGLWRHVGGLWRDEANAVQLAAVPTFAEMLQNLDYDSIPLGFLLVLRAGASLIPLDDSHLRALGLLVGLAIVGAMWLTTRALGVRAPLFCLGLWALNPMLIRYGDSVRAYGSGIFWMVVAAGAIWRAARVTSPGRVLLAAAAAVLSVQFLYYNAPLLLGICAGGAAVTLAERRWRATAAVIGIGATAAVSLLFYVPVFRRVNDWNFLLHHQVDLAWLWQRVSQVTGSPDPLGVWLWAGVFLLAVGLAVYGLMTRRSPGTVNVSEADDGRAALRFAGAALLVGTAAYAGFLWKLNYFTQPWYYLSVLTLAAICLDVIFVHAVPLSSAPGAMVWRGLRVGLCVVFAAAAFAPGQQALRLRHTNMDLVAAELNRTVAAGDLVLFTRWECAISFVRYYHGPAPMVTLPPLADHRFHRYDLLKQQMMAADPLGPAFAAMEDALRSGHHVWVVGPTLFQPPGHFPPMLPPARMTPAGWLGGRYDEVWAKQASYFLQIHATGGRAVPVPSPEPVGQFESLPLSVAQGWREPAPAPAP